MTPRLVWSAATRGGGREVHLTDRGLLLIEGGGIRLLSPEGAEIWGLDCQGCQASPSKRGVLLLEERKLRLLDWEGIELWSTEVEADSILFADGDLAVLRSGRLEIEVVGLGDGSILWQGGLPCEPISVDARGSRLFVLCENSLLCLELSPAPAHIGASFAPPPPGEETVLEGGWMPSEML